VTILNNLKVLFRSVFRLEPAQEDIGAVFRFKYGLFKELLTSNTQLLDIITDMEEKLQGHQLFGMSYVRSNATRAVFHAFRMVKSLDVLSGHRYPMLYPVLEGIHQKIKAEIEQKKEITAPALVLPYAEITKDMTDWVGGKSAHLGEVQNRLHLPIPRGFAITTAAYETFLAANDLVEEINKRKLAIDINDLETIREASAEIQEMITRAPIPPALEEAILGAYAQMSASLPQGEAPPRVSLRSSAIGEDSELSFAGQYLTALNVTSDNLLESYQAVLASLYTPRAISYRLIKGIRDEDIAMSVACLQMVDSLASGVMYSRHPVLIMEDTVIINAVWGLGPYVVEGILTPDTYRIAKDADLTILETTIHPKPVQLVNSPEGGVEEIPVPPERQGAACLTPEQIRTLAAYAVKLEQHYGVPQDIEWALDQEGRLLVLQARPLRLKSPEEGEVTATPRLPGYPVLVEGGAVACAGVGCGPAYHVRDTEDLKDFPDGAVLVARHSSPKFVMVMRRAQGIVADHGSVSGHMAALTREFGAPTILGVEGATEALTPGMEVTVDAYSGRVYKGRVPELLELQRPRETHMMGTPVYQTLRRIADLVVPLHLIDPQAPTFTPESCQSLHDISRFVHELSYKVMFQVSDHISYEKGGAIKLTAPIPLDLYIVDLGEGLVGRAPRAQRVTVDNIASVPFQALMRGMLHEDLRGLEPRPIHVSGLLSVMREQMLSGPGERFGDRSYAVISAKYLNFSSRVGYHYSVLDSYCGDNLNNNYITFSFKGGAADDVRKNRRVRAIARVMELQDFTVNVKGDQVSARLLKYARPVIEEKLEMIGRLLLFTRQMDMLMDSEYSVDAVVQNFLAGNYRYDQALIDQLRQGQPAAADTGAGSGSGEVGN
jgi:pyruvate,water dikinase